MFKMHVLLLTNGPIAVNGFYPLYTTLEEARGASPEKTYHQHKFNGKTYYMPDGVTHYHGDYRIKKT
tara:strand:+ start:759 stop:959 length:201 start_codon:yes stop_codon:yes gene_type:complete